MAVNGLPLMQMLREGLSDKVTFEHQPDEGLEGTMNLYTLLNIE